MCENCVAFMQVTSWQVGLPFDREQMDTRLHFQMQHCSIKQILLWQALQFTKITSFRMADFITQYLLDILKLLAVPLRFHLGIIHITLACHV